MALAVTTNVHLIEGRMFTPGLYELIVGKKAHERYIGLDLGQSIKLQRRSWKVVGVFDADGSGFESEIWGDLEVMGPAFNRSNGYSSLTLRLKNPADVEKFNEDLKRNPRCRSRRCPSGSSTTTRPAASRRRCSRWPASWRSSWASAPSSAR